MLRISMLVGSEPSPRSPLWPKMVGFLKLTRLRSSFTITLTASPELAVVSHQQRSANSEHRQRSSVGGQLLRCLRKSSWSVVSAQPAGRHNLWNVSPKNDPFRRWLHETKRSKSVGGIPGLFLSRHAVFTGSWAAHWGLNGASASLSDSGEPILWYSKPPGLSTLVPQRLRLKGITASRVDCAMADVS